ncbi:MAG: 5-formyltetrahydrofolate cyclo-ligase [Hyphomicrobiaceae bacterium]|nr:5-formyltetrahydrofolate cyclo-ligase [Hyphomicrobiaceae bacterium]
MAQEHSIDVAKRALREQMYLRRGNLSTRERTEGSAKLAQSGLAFIDLPPGVIIAGYSAIRDELDPARLLASLAGAGHPIALPVTVARGEPLQFRRWTPGAELRPGDFSVPVPGPDAKILVPDILLVPMLAFDRQGYRLGYGAGYYDRTLAALRDQREITAIGLAFDIQQVELVPHDRYDERLDWVLTPSGLLKIER